MARVDRETVDGLLGPQRPVSACEDAEYGQRKKRQLPAEAEDATRRAGPKDRVEMDLGGDGPQHLHAEQGRAGARRRPSSPGSQTEACNQATAALPSRWEASTTTTNRAGPAARPCVGRHRIALGRRSMYRIVIGNALNRKNIITPIAVPGCRGRHPTTARGCCICPTSERPARRARGEDSGGGFGGRAGAVAEAGEYCPTTPT